MARGGLKKFFRGIGNAARHVVQRVSDGVEGLADGAGQAIRGVVTAIGGAGNGIARRRF